MRGIWTTWVLTAAVVVTASGGQGEGKLRIGAAEVEITPAPGTPMSGYYSARAASGVHDPLHAKALVVDAGGDKLAFVVCDLISTTRSLVERSRSVIEQQTGIPRANIMLSATHTHTGPVLRDGSSRSHALGGESQLAHAYFEDLVQKIGRAVELAVARLAPGSVEFGKGTEDQISFNRRFHMKDGSVGWNPGRMNPNISRPAGPIDPSLPVMLFQSASGSPVALYVNFAMHLDTVGGLHISADYPYTLSKIAKCAKGEELVTLFTIGAAGDINHINVAAEAQMKGPAEAERIGMVLAGEMLKTLSVLQPLTSVQLQAFSEVIELPLAEISTADVERAREVVKQEGESKPPPFLERVFAHKVLDVDAREGKPIEAEVQVFTMGNKIAWVALPGEIFVELGLTIQRASPFPMTVIVTLANGSVGYVPTQVAYLQGNYEPVSARVGRGAGEKLVDEALALLNRAYSRAVVE